MNNVLTHLMSNRMQDKRIKKKIKYTEIKIPIDECARTQRKCCALRQYNRTVLVLQIQTTHC